MQANEKILDWVAMVNLCPSGSAGQEYQLRAITVQPDVQLGIPLATVPPHACVSPTAYIKLKERVVSRVDSSRRQETLQFYLGKPQTELTTTDSFIVTANVWYAGFVEPVRAWIDWGDGRGWEQVPARQGRAEVLSYTYNVPGPKEVKLRVDGQDSSQERHATLTISPGNPKP